MREIKIKLRFYAIFEELTGKKSVSIRAPSETTIAGLSRIVLNKIPCIAQYRGGFIIAVNDELTSKCRVLKEGDTVALMPPANGG